MELKQQSTCESVQVVEGEVENYPLETDREAEEFSPKLGEPDGLRLGVDLYAFN